MKFVDTLHVYWIISLVLSISDQTTSPLNYTLRFGFGQDIAGF